MCVRKILISVCRYFQRSQIVNTKVHVGCSRKPYTWRWWTISLQWPVVVVSWQSSVKFLKSVGINLQRNVLDRQHHQLKLLLAPIRLTG